MSPFPPAASLPAPARVSGLRCPALLATTAVALAMTACGGGGNKNDAVQGVRPDPPVIVAPSSVTALQGGYLASVAPAPGVTYAWGVAGGSLTPGGDTPKVVFMAGPLGPVSALRLTCTATNEAGSTASSVDLPIQAGQGELAPLPLVPVVAAPQAVTGNQPGYLATVHQPGFGGLVSGPGPLPPAPDPANLTNRLPEPGVTYQWTISSGGTVTGDPASNSATFTPVAKGGQPVTLTCIATNAAGFSSQGSAWVTVQSGPVMGVDATQPGLLTGLTEPVDGMAYAWTVTGGTILAGDQTPQVQVAREAGAATTLTLTATSQDTGAAQSTTITVPASTAPAAPSANQRPAA
jgi:hypothetical protein